jgi:transcriptional regulator with XRE-family HTH domain
MRVMPAPRMTAQEARDHIARLGISQQALARLIMVNPTTVRRWINIKDPLDIPQAVALLLRLLTPAKVKRLIEEAEGNGNRQGREDNSE